MFNNIICLNSEACRWACVDDDGEPIYCGNFRTGKAVCIDD